MRECCARCAYRVMWHNCFSRCSRPIGMKKLSYKNRCKVACHAHELTLFTGHKQMFLHTHLTRSPPIGIAKLSEVFMNIYYYMHGSIPKWGSLRWLRKPCKLHARSVMNRNQQSVVVTVHEPVINLRPQFSPLDKNKLTMWTQARCLD